MDYNGLQSNLQSLLFDSEVLKLKFGIKADELEALRAYGARHQTDIDVFIDAFYQWMEAQEEFQYFFSSQSTLERVKNKQNDYWKVFFQAEINPSYINQRIHIGSIHAKIGLPIYSYSAAMNYSSQWWLSFIEQSRNKGEFGKKNAEAIKQAEMLSNALIKLIHLDVTIITETYHQRTQQKYKQTLDETNKMVHDIEIVAEDIINGNFSIKLQGEGKINTAFNKMIEAINESTIKSEKENWLKNAHAQLMERLRGDPSLESIANQCIEFLTKYLQANVGVFYYLMDGKLKLYGSYAYQRRKNLSHQFDLGQGLIGQVVLEKQAMIVENLPEDYLTVSSGLGESKAPSTLIFPVLFEGKVTAVLEMGSFKPFDEKVLSLLEVINDAIASVIESSKNREQLKTLLMDTQKKSEELEAQSNRLEKANADLAQQTSKLKASEEELKAQSEEMMVTNEELEEKTQALEAQKKDIVRQNERLSRSQKMLEERTRELQSSSKYKSEFLSNMSHELRTPLNSLLILAQSLLENPEENLNKDQLQAATIIHKSGKDLLNLINDILDLSKVEAGKLQIELSEFNLPELVRELEMQMLPLAKNSGVKFIVELDDDLPLLMKSDAMRLMQVLKNLISNAIKFTNKGGRVSFSVCQSAVEENPGLNQLDNPAISFIVEDTGIGIPKEQQKAIFEAFQQVDGTTSRKYNGTGLGLTISRQLAHLLGGDIVVKSHEGQGSVFTLFLPVNSVEKVALEEKTPAMSRLQAEKPLILLINNDESFNHIVIKHLKERQLEFVEAKSGKDGLNKALNLQPSAIILDASLPDMNGLVLLDQLKHEQVTHHIPVHVVSTSDVKEESIQRGAIGFISKPVQEKKLSKLFDKASKIIKEPIQNILLVEDNEIQRQSIKKLIATDNTRIYEAATAKQAKSCLMEHRIHCMILDISLPDQSGKAFLEEISSLKEISLPPVIVHTAGDISEEEEKILSQYTPSIILKSADAPQRLMDEVNLFLNSLDEHKASALDLPDEISKFPEQNIEGKKILLVDDDMRNNIAMGSYLRKHGFLIVTADNGELALQRLEEEDSVDLVLMDIMMPVMDGYTAIKRIREKALFQELPIIALTAKAMADDREKCIAAGANDYLTKPVNMEKLFNLFQVWLT